MTKKKELSVDELTKEVSYLKSQIGGFRKANDMYRKKIQKLEKQVKHNREVDVEGDHLYEEKLAELEKTKKELGKYILKVDSKEMAIEALRKTNKDLESHAEALKEALDEAERTVAELRKPWWKRLF